jgi:hypothetical protein
MTLPEPCRTFLLYCLLHLNFIRVSYEVTINHVLCLQTRSPGRGLGDPVDALTCQFTMLTPHPSPYGNLYLLISIINCSFKKRAEVLSAEALRLFS